VVPPKLAENGSLKGINAPETPDSTHAVAFLQGLMGVFHNLLVPACTNRRLS